MNIFSFKPNPLPKWNILIFAPPGNGKSLEQARLSEETLKEYRWIEKHYPKLPTRYLLTNQKLNKEYICKENKFSSEWFDAHVRLWEDAEELKYCHRENCFKGKEIHKLHDCDLFCDEGATLFPATAKGADDDMPMWLKKLIAQHRHNGIRILILTQDFMQINIAERRCLWQSFYMHKILGSRDISPTLPPVKFIWGIYSKRMIDPELMKKDFSSILINIRTADDEKKKIMEELKLIGRPKLYWIGKHKCSLYDTTQDVKEYEIRRTIEHIEVPCKHKDCGYVHKKHLLK